MNYASEELINEHMVILYGIRILEKMVLLLKNNEKVETDDFRSMVDFLKLFAEKCHHGKEEGLFFPALEEAGVKNKNGPIGQMLIEHAQGRKYVAQMAESLTDHSIKEHDLITAGTNYVDLLRAHINKENRGLFPLADAKIPADKQTRLLTLFKEFEEKVMGPGTHEKLHKLLHQYDEKYLKSDLQNDRVVL